MSKEAVQFADSTLSAINGIQMRYKSVIDKATEMYCAINPKSTPCMKRGDLEEDKLDYELMDLCVFAALNSTTESTDIHRGFNHAFTTEDEYDVKFAYSLYKMLSERITDPRKNTGRTFDCFSDFLIVCIFAAFSGVTSANGISKYCKEHFMFFK